MISRRHSRRIIALLLPLMLLRAMLPVGFMPVAENGALHMTLCGEGHHHPAATESSADQASDQTNSGNHGHSGESGYCPFASALVNAAPLGTALSVSVVSSEMGAIFESAAPVRIAAIVRTQSARGPPSFSL